MFRYTTVALACVAAWSVVHAASAEPTASGRTRAITDLAGAAGCSNRFWDRVYMGNEHPQNNWDFPLALPKSPLRRLAKQAIGRALLTISPGLERRIIASGKAKTLAERIAVAGLIAKHRAAGSLERLAPLHAAFWSSDDAVDFHRKHDERFQKVFLGPHYVLVQQLTAIVADGGFSQLYEVGCGSGQVTDHLSSCLDLSRFTGLDLSPSQIERNKARYHNPNLTFVAGDGAQWLRSRAATGSIVFTYGGVLEYFTEAALRSMFTHLSKLSPACVALAEPVDKGFDLQTEVASRAAGPELSYSHNYPRLLEESGFNSLLKNSEVRRFFVLAL